MKRRVAICIRRIRNERGVAMVEYSLLLAGLVITMGELAPGGQLYNILATDLSFRLWIISLPIL